MKQTIEILKTYFESGDRPGQQDFVDLIESFVHKDDGKTVANINKDKIGNVTIKLSDGSTFTIDKYQLPNTIPLAFVEGLENILIKINTEAMVLEQKLTQQIGDFLGQTYQEFDGIIVKSVNKDTNGDVTFIFSDDSTITISKDAMPESMPVSFIEGLQTILDGFNKDLSEVKTSLTAQLTDLTNNTYDRTEGNLVTNIDTLSKNGDIIISFSDGTAVTVAQYRLPDSLPIAFIDGLQALVDQFTEEILELRTNKRDLTAQANSITDVNGNLELVGDVESPGASTFYGTDSNGNKGYHKFPSNYFHRSNVFIGGSSSNLPNQEFEIDLSAFEELELGDVIAFSDFEFRGDFSASQEFLTVSFDTPDNAAVVLGDFNSFDDDQWSSANDSGDGSVATIVALKNGGKGLKVYVSPSAAVNFAPTGMTNWWELKANNIQFKLQKT